MTTTKTSETAAKKDVAKLQRAIVDGLEDVKAQDIQVFNTEHLSPLFERVIVASGTSNRQTKALAASVRDKVKEAGFVKPRIEGEDNGEWIIVDCGSAVAHIMQPTIRQYYRLEELWGDTPVRLKLGAAKPAAPAAAKVPAKTAARTVWPQGGSQGRQGHGRQNCSSPQRSQACQQARRQGGPQARHHNCGEDARNQDSGQDPRQQNGRQACSQGHQGTGRQDPHEDGGGQAA